MGQDVMGTQRRPLCSRRPHRLDLVTIWQEDNGAEQVLGPGFQNVVQLIAFKSPGKALGDVIGRCSAPTSQHRTYKVRDNRFRGKDTALTSAWRVLGSQ